MKEEADEAEPLTLVDGQGNNLGTWVIKKISETQSNYFRDGIPKKIDFSLDLEKYGDDEVSSGGSGDNGGGGFNWLSLFA